MVVELAFSIVLLLGLAAAAGALDSGVEVIVGSAEDEIADEAAGAAPTAALPPFPDAARVQMAGPGCNHHVSGKSSTVIINESLPWCKAKSRIRHFRSRNQRLCMCRA